jgi:hypothetical protein
MMIVETEEKILREGEADHPDPQGTTKREIEKEIEDKLSLQLLVEA